MNVRAYMSIGDVLTLLRQEFPDVTISKIRFLESQGLVDPERTPSGYRKFYEQDVERLRWVLRQQREHFLPLKVIKGRLEDNGEEDDYAGEPPPALVGSVSGQPLPGFEAATAGHPAARRPSANQARGRQPVRSESVRSSQTRAGTGGASQGRAEALDAASSPVEAAAKGGSKGSAGPNPQPKGQTVSKGQPKGPSEPKARPETEPVALAEGDRTFDELVEASGCSPATVAGLESYGLIGGRRVGGVLYFGDDALVVAQLAASFAEFGVEPRHLRLHKHSAEREAGFIEQVVLPMFKQRNPEARQRAHDTVSALSRLGQELRSVLLKQALRTQLGG